METSLSQLPDLAGRRGFGSLVGGLDWTKVILAEQLYTPTPYPDPLYQQVNENP